MRAIFGLVTTIILLHFLTSTDVVAIAIAAAVTLLVVVIRLVVNTLRHCCRHSNSDEGSGNNEWLCYSYCSGDPWRFGHSR